MSLFSRLTDPVGGEVKIPAHQFMAAMSELVRGEFTRSDIETMFNMTPAERTQFDNFINKASSVPASRRFEFGRLIHDMLLLAELKLAYTTQTDFIARLNRF